LKDNGVAMSKIAGKNVLITGGASGIGRIMGRMVLEKGAANLIVWDINENALQQTKAEFAAISPNVHTYTINLADTEQIKTTAQKVLADVGPVHILINNAGIIVGKLFHEHTHNDITATMMINASALMHATLEFLPQMLKQNDGHICNIASAAGLLANPKMAVYCASKWAVTGWSESLRIEMDQAGANVHVTTVAPYYITTGMFAGVSSRIPLLEPESTARRIIKAIEGNKLTLRMPWIVNIVPFWKAILPARWFDVIVGRGFGIYKTMSTFKGRN
jgi:all-trans-retinol dehydrogenase (NAD+)